jgi:hypothetical protein
MTKIFLFSFNIGQIDPSIIQSRLNSAPEIHDWLLLSGGLLLVKTYDELALISKKIQNAFPNMQFLVTQVTPYNCDGWMPQAVWNFIQDGNATQAIPAE